MDAFSHASFCLSVAKRVSREFRDKSLNIAPVLGKYYLNGREITAYMHPDDKYKDYDEMIYPFGDI